MATPAASMRSDVLRSGTVAVTLDIADAISVCGERRGNAVHEISEAWRKEQEAARAAGTK